MTLEINRKKYILKTKEIWFAEHPYDVEGAARVVFRACKNKTELQGFTCSEFTTLVIDLTQNLDTIWNNMAKSSCRYEVRRAEKEGIKVRVGQNFKDFIKIDKAFRKAKKLQKSDITDKFIKKYGTLFIDESGGEILGGQVYLEDKNNMRLLFASSKRLAAGNKKAVLIGTGNRLMIWEAIKHAKAKGIKEFDLGGYHAGEVANREETGIRTFKESFGGKAVTHYICQKDYSKVYTLARKFKHIIK